MEASARVQSSTLAAWNRQFENAARLRRATSSAALGSMQLADARRDETRPASRAAPEIVPHRVRRQLGPGEDLEVLVEHAAKLLLRETRLIERLPLAPEGLDDIGIHISG